MWTSIGVIGLSLNGVDLARSADEFALSQPAFLRAPFRLFAFPWKPFDVEPVGSTGFSGCCGLPPRWGRTLKAGANRTRPVLFNLLPFKALDSASWSCFALALEVEVVGFWIGRFVLLREEEGECTDFGSDDESLADPAVARLELTRARWILLGAPWVILGAGPCPR